MAGDEHVRCRSTMDYLYIEYHNEEGGVLANDDRTLLVLHFFKSDISLEKLIITLRRKYRPEA